jgi:hypothetical protein
VHRSLKQDISTLSEFHCQVIGITRNPIPYHSALLTPSGVAREVSLGAGKVGGSSEQFGAPGETIDQFHVLIRPKCVYAHDCNAR